jgi:NTE family protein
MFDQVTSTAMTSAVDSGFAAGGPRGYTRSAALQQSFDMAAQKLLANDGWPSGSDSKRLVADLALEGGGVKGVGLVGAVLVLEEAGYEFRRIAGTSAGAIAASLIASLAKQGRPMTELKAALDSLNFENFMPEGPLHHFLDHFGPIGPRAADATTLLDRPGLYSGDYLEQWLTPKLAELGVSTFADLALTLEDDPGMSLPDGHQYRLVVHTSDITRNQLVRLPWDYHIYGHTAPSESVAGAVRASMSIPFFFVPVCFASLPAEVSIPTPDGAPILQRYGGGPVTWVDGGMLRNFPINAFDRADGQPARWPTIGIKLSALQLNFGPTSACEHSVDVGIGCLHTMMNEWDTYSVDQDTAARTIFVDNAGLKATQFDITPDQQTRLFLNGVAAATKFVIEKAATGVPRKGGKLVTAQQ